MAGKKNWYFPDGELPPAGADSNIYGHESVIILNTNNQQANVVVTLFFTDKDPVKAAMIEVEAKKVRGVRITQEDGFLGYKIPLEEQYALALESDVPIIVQYGRLDVRQPNMAFYATSGYQE